MNPHIRQSAESAEQNLLLAKRKKNPIWMKPWRWLKCLISFESTISWSLPFNRTWRFSLCKQHSLRLLAGVHSWAMLAPFVVGVKLLITLVTLILVTSWKVDILHMLKRIIPKSADLATQVALNLPNVFPFSDLAGVSMQILLNFSSVFQTGLQPIIPHMQCSQILHGEKIKESCSHFGFELSWGQIRGCQLKMTY